MAPHLSFAFQKKKIKRYLVSEMYQTLLTIFTVYASTVLY